MTARRTKRSDGRYTVTFTHEGKKHFFYGKTQKEARQKADEARERVKIGSPVRDATRTLSDFLAQWVTTTLEASTRSDKTKELHEGFVRRWIVPNIGTVPLDKLKPADVTRILLAMQKADMADSSRRKCLDVQPVSLQGWTCSPDIAGVIVSAAARSLSNPTQARRIEAGAYNESPGSLASFSLLETQVLNGLRRTAA